MEDMGRVKISVIMLTYNREDLVAGAIESILAQTFADFELIIVDNGSQDNSGGIADSYANRDGRVRVIHRQRGNIGSGRNTGLDAAGGEYIAFIDDDDRIEPDYMDFLHSLAHAHDADAAICGTNYLHSEEKLILNAEESIITLMWRRHYNNGFPTKLFRRRLFDGLRFEEQGRYDDIGLMYRILAGAGRVVYHGLPKYLVFRHRNNNSAPTARDGRLTPEFLASYRRAYRDRTEWLSARYPGNSDFWRYFDWSFQISMVNKIVANNPRGCEEHLHEMRRELARNRGEFMSCPWIQGFEKEYMERHVP